MEKKSKGCLHVKDYNDLMIRKWNKDCKEASQEGRWAQMPQLALYVFLTTNGAYCQKGYVAYCDNVAILRPTKKAAVAYLKISYGVTV